jgi:asparagine synthase (glutamine-hydrolysing)
LTVEDGRPEIHRYWSLDFSTKLQPSEEEVVTRIRQGLDEATRIRLVSDVPLGAFLSGGIDSSAIVASMARQMAEPVKTFSIGFGQHDFDELAFARIVAKRFGTDHHEFRVEPDAIRILPKLVRHYGEPFADPSAIPSFYLAELSSNRVTVALNGDGGDEVFAGYPRYIGNQLAAVASVVRDGVQKPLASLVNALAPTSLRQRLLRIVETSGMAAGARYAAWLSALDAGQRRNLLTPEFQASLRDWRSEDVIMHSWHHATASTLVERMQEVDINTYLPGDLLVKMDIATMAASVEARSPFLDQHFLEYTASLPADYKLRRFKSKRILRLALQDVLPYEVLNRPKMGFEVPLAVWFRGELKRLPEETLLDPGALARGYWRGREVERLIREHQSGMFDHSVGIWTLIQLEMWHREVLEGQPLAQVSN